ncbi:AraC family transcriptional regulator [Schleiferilactobacillus harbinensis]|nr:AraC family transcriptional regulator [Schleiferilactobacillus harbinensis]
MAIQHERVQSDQRLPFKAFVFAAHNLDRYIPAHWHQNTELLYCITGKLNVWERNTFHQLAAGDVIIINANVVHSTQSPTANQVLVIQLPLPLLMAVTEGQYTTEFIFSLNTVAHPALKTQPLTAQLETIAQLVMHQENTLADRITLRARVIALIGYLVANDTTANQQQGTVEESLQLANKIANYINQHFREPITLHAAAQFSGYSDGHFSRLFKAFFGMGFHEFLSVIRLDSAFGELVHSARSFDNIAKTAGFGSYRNFYNTFVKYYQMTPSTYRIRYLKQ